MVYHTQQLQPFRKRKKAFREKKIKNETSKNNEAYIYFYEALVKLFKFQRTNNVPISEPIL